jgi:hypothetical protein
MEVRPVPHLQVVGAGQASLADLQTWREAVQVSFVVLTTLFAWKKTPKKNKKRPDCWRRKEQKRKQKRKEFDWIEKRIQ